MYGMEKLRQDQRNRFCKMLKCSKPHRRKFGDPQRDENEKLRQNLRDEKPCETFVVTSTNIHRNKPQSTNTRKTKSELIPAISKNFFKNLHTKQGHSCTSPRNLCQAKTEAMELIGRGDYIIQYIKVEQKLPSLKHLRENVPKTENERKIVVNYLKTKQKEAKTPFEHLTKTENSRSESLNKLTHNIPLITTHNQKRHKNR